MSEDTRRPQDVGRRHRRRGQPSSETRLLLTDYHGAMRRELRGLLAELEPSAVDAPQMQLDGKPKPPERPKLEQRARVWDLAIKLARELGTSIDVPAEEGETPATTAAPRKRRVDFG